jgi:hypothetical protein
MLAFPGSCLKEPMIRSLPSLKPSSTRIAEDEAIAEGPKDQSFAEVLLSKSRPKVEGRSRGEVKNGGVRIDEDCERFVWAAGSAWKRRGSAVKEWVSQLFGFVQLGMGRVVARLLEGLLNGLEGISIHKRVRAILKNLDGSMGFAVGPSHLHPVFAQVVSFTPCFARRG